MSPKTQEAIYPLLILHCKKHYKECKTNIISTIGKNNQNQIFDE